MEHDVIDIIEKVNNYYDSAWNKLIITASIAFGIIGIIMPLFIQWWQRWNLNINKDEIKTQLYNEVYKDLNQKVKKDLVEIESKINKNMNQASGMMLQLEVYNLIKEEKFVNAFLNCLNAAKLYLSSENYRNLSQVLDSAYSMLPNINKNEFFSSLESNNFDLEEFYCYMEKHDDREAIKIHLIKLRQAIMKLK